MGTGYTRQSASKIVDEATIEAADHNAEFNQLEAAFNGSTGHAHDGTLGEGPQINLTTSVTSILPVANGGTGADTKQGVIDNLLDTTTVLKTDRTFIADATDNTKKLSFVLSGLTTGQTRKLTFPDSDVTISSFSASLLDEADAAAWRTALELTAGTYVQPYDADLTAIAGLNSTGFAVRTANNTWAQRTIGGTSGQIDVTNGNGISGNVLIGLASSVTISGTMTANSFSGNLNASQLSSGTVPNARITGAYTGFTNITASGTVTAGNFSGSGAGLTNLDAGRLSSGTIPSARISGSYNGFGNITASGTVTANAVSSNSISSSGTISADIFTNTDGLNGEKYRVGDGASLWDVGLGHTISIRSVSNQNVGFLNFGNADNTFGWDGNNFGLWNRARTTNLFYSRLTDGSFLVHGSLFLNQGQTSIGLTGNITGSIWANYGTGHSDAYTAILNRIESRASAWAIQERNVAIANIIPTIAAQGAGAVGTYAMLRRQAGGVVGAGGTMAGSNLAYASADNDVSGVPPGLWICMGYSAGNAGTASSITLWMRYA